MFLLDDLVGGERPQLPVAAGSFWPTGEVYASY